MRLRSLVFAALPVFAGTTLPAQVFDLADACRGGNGTLPGTGPETLYGINGRRAFLAQPSFPFVDGIFVPLATGATVINSKGLTYDFSSKVKGTGTNGSPGNGTGGASRLRINDPSRKNGNPDYTGDKANHSIMACHASVGITFDLAAIRNVFPEALVFTANAGGSCGGWINYFVLIDGKAVASGGGLRSNNFQSVRVAVPPMAKYLTLATGDDNRGTINCAHGYWGDPFLGCGWSTFGEGGTDSTKHQMQVRANGCPTVGNSVGIGAELGKTNKAPILVFLGGSITQWHNLKLPVDLTPLGATGNRVYVSLDFQAGRINHGGGGGLATLKIPNNPSLRNQIAWVQAVAADFGANRLGFVTSNALVMKLQ